MNALAAFLDAKFDWTRQLENVWSDPPYHVDELNGELANTISDYFIDRCQPGTDPPPGWAIL
jgi:hypothetical protein